MFDGASTAAASRPPTSGSSSSAPRSPRTACSSERAAVCLPDDGGLRGRPVHPAHQPQVALRHAVGEAAAVRRAARLRRRARARRLRRSGARAARGRARSSASSSWWRAARAEASDGVSVAINLLFSYVRAGSRAAPRGGVRESACRTLPVSVSSEIAPIWREYERAQHGDRRRLPRAGSSGASPASSTTGSQGTASQRAVPAAQVERRPDPGRRGRGQRRQPHPLGARRRPDRRPPLRERGSAAPRRRHARHGRDELRRRRRRRRRRSATPTQYEFEWGLPIAVPVVDLTTIGAGGSSIVWLRPGRTAEGRPGERGRRPRPCRLRARRDGGDGHGCEPRPRPSQPGLLPRRRAAARRGPRACRSRFDRRAAGRAARGGGAGDRRARDREHGERDPAAGADRGPRLPALRADRVRRRRPAPRRARSRAASASRASSCRPTPGSPPRSARSPPTCASTAA